MNVATIIIDGLECYIQETTAILSNPRWLMGDKLVPVPPDFILEDEPETPPSSMCTTRQMCRAAHRRAGRRFHRR